MSLSCNQRKRQSLRKVFISEVGPPDCGLAPTGLSILMDGSGSTWSAEGLRVVDPGG